MVLGIDIGGTSFKYGLVDSKGNILNTASIMVDLSLSQEDMLLKLAEAINNWLTSLNISKSSIKGIGIGCPGSINSKTGFCDYSNNLPWKDLNVCGILEEKLGYKCKITNDANAATLGEFYFGAGKEFNNIIMLTLGTGVGGGIVIDGRLYEGNESKGAELGHAVIVVNGRECSCGRRGCFETYASTTALIKQARLKMAESLDSILWDLCEHDLSKVTGKVIFEACRKNDKAALEVLDEYIMYLGEGILNYCSIFKPEAVILGGGISYQKEYLSDKVDAYCRKRNYGFGLGPTVKIKTATLGNDAGIIGAASLWLSK